MGKRGPHVKVEAKKAVSLSTPLPPSWLDAQALKRWEQLIPELDELGVLNRVDFGVLARYCSIWSQWVDCLAVIQIKGIKQHVLSSQGDYEKESVEFSASKKLHDSMMKIEESLGMNATSRKTLAISEKEKEEVNPFEVLRLSLKKSG